MKKLIPAGVLAAALSAGSAYAQQVVEPVMSDRIGKVAPALHKYTTEGLFGAVWANENLSTRDRSLVTVAILIARNQADEIGDDIGRTLETGVTPAEISEAITHLAFYSGWSNAMSAVNAAAGAFEAAGVSADQLPAVNPEPLPLDQQAEDAREARVSGDVVWFPAGEKHWHGASPEVAMTHIAIQESIDGSPVTWMEKVTDTQYRG